MSGSSPSTETTPDLSGLASQKPPENASNDPADIAAGVPREASAELLAAAAAAPAPVAAPGARAPSADPAAAAAPSYDPKEALGDDNLEGDGELAKLLANDETPAWLRTNIKIERDRRRAAIAAQKAAEEEARRLREEIQASKAPAVPAEPERPARDKYASPEEYDQAIDAWTAAKAEHAVATARAKEATERAAKAREDAEQQQQRSAAALAESWQAKRAAAIQAHPDFVAVAENESIPITPQTALAIAQEENGAEIAYYLGKNRNVAVEISGMAPERQAVAIGKIAVTLALGAKADVSRAPAPIEPLAAARAPAAPGSDEPTMEEIAARERKRAAESRTPMWGHG